MAIRTSSQAGNTNSAPFAFASAVVAGDTLVCNHAVAVDANVAIGLSLPNRPPARPTLSQSAGGGSLPGGVYFAQFTNVDAGGGESPGSPATTTLTLTAGNTLVVTLPLLPAGVTSRKIYLSAAGGGTATLYATGVTATATNCTSASWTDGTTTQAAAAGVPADSATFALTVNSPGSLTLNAGVTLTCKGEVKQGNGAITLSGGSTFAFDSSASVGTTGTRYACLMGTGSAQTGCKWATTGTSQASRATIASNPAGGCAWFGPGFFAGMGATATDGVNFALTWAKFSRIGDATTNSLQFAPASAAVVQSFDHVQWDACGQITWLTGPPAAGGFSFTNCWTTASNCANGSIAYPEILTLPGNATAPTTGTRLVQNCAFDVQVHVSRYGTFTGNYFGGAYNPTSMVGACASFDSNVVRITSGLGLECPGGSFSNNYIWMDPFGSTPTYLATGTATAATATSLTDSGAAFTTTWAGSNDGVNHSYAVLITSGPAAGQMGELKVSTATGLGWKVPMSPAPAAGAGYAVFDCLPVNPHYITGTSFPFTATGNVFEFPGSSPNGDCLLHMDVASGVYAITGNLCLPNGGRDNSGTITLFGLDSTQTYAVDHNTWYGGGQSLIAINEAGNQPAGRVTSLRSNLCWINPANTSAFAASGQLGPFVANDTTNAVNPANGTLGVISAADYNGKYGLAAGYSTNGYNVNVTSPGTHDVVGDPQFVDPARNLMKWGGTVGVTGLPPAFATAIRSTLLAANDPLAVGYVAGATPSSLIAYVKAGFMVQAPALNNAGHDSVTIGAMGFLAPSGAAFAGSLDAQSIASALTAATPAARTATFAVTAAAQVLAAAVTATAPASRTVAFAGPAADQSLAAPAVATAPGSGSAAFAATLGGQALAGSAATQAAGSGGSLGGLVGIGWPKFWTWAVAGQAATLSYAGTAAVAAGHPLAVAGGGTSAPVYSGVAAGAVGHLLTTAAANGVSSYAATAALAGRPLLGSAAASGPPAYVASAALAGRYLLEAASLAAVPGFAGSAALVGPSRAFAATATCGALLCTGTAALLARPVVAAAGSNGFGSFQYRVTAYVPSRFFGTASVPESP